MGCGCSGGSAHAARADENEPPPPWPGENGWLHIEYLGGAPTPRDWRGLYTGLMYQFGGDKRRGYVDFRDGIKMVAPRLMGGASPVFRVIRESTGNKARKTKKST